MVGILCSLLLLISVQGDQINVGDIRNVIKLERELLHNFRNYANELEAKLRLINGAIDEYSELVKEADGHPDLYLRNPLFAFRLISHMRRDWPSWQQHMMQPVGKDVVELQQRLLTLAPTPSVYKEAAQSLLSVFRFYNYEPSSFLMGNKQHLSLSPMDCYNVGVELFEQQKFHEAIHWLEVAANNYTTSPHNELFGVPHWRVYEMQFKVFSNLNMRIEAIDALLKALELEPQNERLQQYQLDLLNSPELVDPLPAPAKIVSDLQQRCRGNYMRDTELVCELNTIVAPFLRLAPLRLEEMLYEPYVMLYKDGIYEREILHIQDAFARCPPSATLEAPEGVKGCSISDNYSQVTKVLTERVADMTGLNKHMKNMFVFEYGPSDPFWLLDLYKLKKVNFDDIEATSILFLNDMELGGAITISNQEVAVFPRRGDAVIIFNEGDFQITMCPNVVGKRLVVIKFWFPDDLK